jgi:NAD(P)-dependent dehydrogenase (short-subunit alcohol dehydrogenase family)
MSNQNSAPKIILVTGGGRGLGRNTAISAARSGFDVIITYHSNRDTAAEVVSEIEGYGRKAVALRLDTTDVGSFDAFVASLRSELDRLDTRTSTLSSTTRASGWMPHLRRPRKSCLIALLTFISRACSS